MRKSQSRGRASSPAERARLVVQYGKPDRFTPYARNARTHSDAQVRQIRASIEEFGFNNPILVKDDGATIGAGHGRHAAALLEPALAQVPFIVLPGLTEHQWRAYVIADNKLALNAGWDEDLLRFEISQLAAMDFDLELVGFDSDELEALLNPPNPGERDPDETPEPPAAPITVLGDVWLLGSHRITCGDSTDADAVTRALGGAEPRLMVTDPPYGVEYDANWRNEAARSSQGMGSRSLGAGAVGKVLNDDKADWREAWALFPGDVAYVWHAGLFAATVADSLDATGFRLRSQIVWAKQQFAIGRGDYHWQHEPCWYAVRKGAKGHYDGGRKQSTLWEIPKPAKSETGHSTQKPVECMRRPIENNSKPGQAIYEPFSGSGTTLIAAELTGRMCCAIELNPAYVDVAVERWENFTGRVATLEATGQTFREVSDERRRQAAA